MEPATVEPAAISVHATQGSLTMALTNLAALVRTQQHPALPTHKYGNLHSMNLMIIMKLI